MFAFEAVVFDFDYTLVDSSEGIIACVNNALRTHGLPEASAQDIRPTIGLPLLDVFGQLAARAAADSDGRLAADLTRAFIEHADRVMANLTVVYPYVPQAIRALRDTGLRLAIVTTKFRYRVANTLPPELLSAFDVIVGFEDVDRPKPDPQGLLLALTRLGVRPEAGLYVGDSPTDAQTAQRAGVAFVAVLSGVTPQETFSPYAPYAILPDVACLPPLLDASRCRPPQAPGTDHKVASHT